jgi:hypothetical protein
MKGIVFNQQVEEPYATSNQKVYRNHNTSNLTSKESSSQKKLLEIYSTKSLLEGNKDMKELHDACNEYNDTDKYEMAPNRYVDHQWKLMKKDTEKPYIGHYNDLNRNGYEHKIKHQ